MGADAESSLRTWKRVAAAALLASGALFFALVAAIAFPARTARITDERLIGTWQSDAERTIAGIREQRPVDEKQEAVLRKLFGKMRITYTATTYTAELDGAAETSRYTVLGRDKLSTVLREVGPEPSPLEVTEFGLIYFDGPDAYWLYTKVGGIQEWFKRVQ